MKILNPKINLENFFIELSKKRALLILDYDGTLSPFSTDPALAFPYPGVCEKIQKIMQTKQTRVVVLSGRALGGLKKLLNLDPPPEMWGSHGGERWKLNDPHPTVKKIDPKIKDLLAEAAREAQTLAPGLYIENKPLSVALHWRGKEAKMAQEQSSHVLTQWRKHLLEHPLEIHAFDEGVELRIQGINKGEAVKTLMKEVSPDTLIAYLGDDETDEEAFEVMGNRALKVLVRNVSRPTLADLQITPLKELLTFLDRWLQSQTGKS